MASSTVLMRAGLVFQDGQVDDSFISMVIVLLVVLLTHGLVCAVSVYLTRLWCMRRDVKVVPDPMTLFAYIVIQVSFASPKSAGRLPTVSICAPCECVHGSNTRREISDRLEPWSADAWAACKI